MSNERDTRGQMAQDQGHSPGEPYQTRRSAGRSGSPRPSRRRLPVAVTIIIDVLVAALIMLAFYLQNYAFPGELLPVAGPTPAATPVMTAAPTPSPTEDGATLPPSEEPTAEPSPTPAGTPTLREKFADQFTSGEVIQTDSSYRSANVSVTITRHERDGATYYLADIYVADVKYFRTCFARNVEKIAYREPTDVIARQVNAIVAINGDLCLDNDGFVLRNGLFYKDQRAGDQLVLYDDGTMAAYGAEELDREAIKSGTAGAWQVWTFGPSLLTKDGQPMTDFVSPQRIAGRANPRTAVGYYEPGHYCFLVVDGRQPGYSTGMTCAQMSQIFYELGCTVAFNLDGGQSSEMAFMGNLVNQPYNGGRNTSDILYIADELPG